MTIRRVLPSPGPMPLFDIVQTRAIEQRAQAATPTHDLMRRAGLATAQLALALAPHAERVWIVAGPGNNGGDGFEAALHLSAWGRQVHITTISDTAALPPDAKNAHARAHAAGVSIGATPPPSIASTDIAIDALLGIGTRRAPEGAMAALINQFNALPCARLAIDLPSGLHADTGERLGEACIEAHHTLAMLTLKPGLFTASGRDQAGCVWLDSLAVDTSLETPTAWLCGARSAERPTRQHHQHKGSFGDVAVVGGAIGMTGAALLAARAAHAAGAGRVFVGLLGSPALAHDPLRPELMFRPSWPGSNHGALAATTVVCGCGGGDAVRSALPALLGGAPRLVLDADALNALAADPMLQTLLRARAARGLCSVLTPHPLEAARLLGTTAREVQADRLAAAGRLAARFCCTVLLKGSGTVVVSPDTVPSINPTGNASLASAGTGDVLAGWLGGLWAQWGERSTAPPEVAHAVAVAAAYAHGRAADGASASALRAADLIELMLSRDATAPR